MRPRTPRRLTKIVVEEISLVKDPANRTPVLAYKAMRGMDHVREVMEDYGVDESEMADMAGMDEKRMRALMTGDAEPTEGEMEALMDACEECEDEDVSKRDVGAKSARKSETTFPELAKYVPRDASPSDDRPTSYHAETVMSQLSGLAKEWTTSYDTAPRRDGEPDGVTDEDRARERNRIDAHGIANVNSEALYPAVHVPPAKVVGAPTSV